MAEKKSKSAKSTKKAKKASAPQKSETESETESRKRKPKKARGDEPASTRASNSSAKASKQNVTLSRDRLQEVVDDAVKRGRMTRGDAEKMLSDMVKRAGDRPTAC